MPDFQSPPEDVNRDLGFGSRVAQQSRARFLNRDGSFNVMRRGLSLFRTRNFYHALLTMPWWKFFGTIILGYILTNFSFAWIYFACGPSALTGSSTVSPLGRFGNDFFFSVQTISTIGYGQVLPATAIVNIIVTIEVLIGLLGFALATGLLFARFSRPTAKIIYSRTAIIAPYRGITAFEFRIANERSNELIEVNVKVTLSRDEIDSDGRPLRRFYPLALERDSVVFFPLHWVIVHPISKASPLYGITQEELDASKAEFLILLTAVDETFEQTVHSRSSYRYDEVIWNAKFSDLFQPSDDDKISIDLRRIHEIERVNAANKSK